VDPDNSSIREICDYKGDVCAIILYNPQTDFLESSFFTKPDEEFQLALFVKGQGDKVDRHFHLNQSRSIRRTSEVLILLSGEMQLTIFDDIGGELSKLALGSICVVLLLRGQHSIEFSQNARMLEVKQGPYDARRDKILV
jgi:hypothetical protein